MEEMIKQLRDTANSVDDVGTALTALDENKYEDVIDALSQAVGYLRDAVKMAENIH